MTPAPQIIGIGYEGVSQSELVGRLVRESVATVFDVRLNPISRKKRLSKRALAEALSDAGISYVHLPELGNVRGNRAGYAKAGTPVAEETRQRFRQSLATDSAQKALATVHESALAQKVALLCFEADQRHCHREQVIEEIWKLHTAALVGI